VVKEHVEILVLGETTGLERLQDELALVARAWKLSRTMLLELNLVLEELCVNAMEHGHLDATGHIRITLDRCDQMLDMKVEVAGPPHDPTKTVLPSTTLALADRQEGGLGLLFVKQYTDSCRYQRVDDRNILFLTKKIRS
jgi:serine/threonine-protein kinase RsbW